MVPFDLHEPHPGCDLISLNGGNRTARRLEGGKTAPPGTCEYACQQQTFRGGWPTLAATKQQADLGGSVLWLCNMAGRQPG